MNSDFNNQSNQNSFTLYFSYKLKEIYLDNIDENTPFNLIFEKLSNRYDWIKRIKVQNLVFNNQPINLNLTCKQLNIPNESKIAIIG